MSWEQDHEFPWIETDWLEGRIRCLRCGEEVALGNLIIFSNWIIFTTQHGECEEKKEAADVLVRRDKDHEI